MKEIIESINKERQILTEALSKLDWNTNGYYPVEGSIKARLKELDDLLLNLAKEV